MFKEYSYMVTAAFDGAALTIMFILSFSVLGAGGPPRPFPKWWGNNGADGTGNYDWCPVANWSERTRLKLEVAGHDIERVVDISFTTGLTEDGVMFYHTFTFA